MRQANKKRKKGGAEQQGGNKRKPPTPFRKFTEADAALIAKPELADNTFEAKGESYGQAAHEVLSKVRGKGFTRAKNKKKNSYRGGGFLDPNAVRSIKFED